MPGARDQHCDEIREWGETSFDQDCVVVPAGDLRREANVDENLWAPFLPAEGGEANTVEGDRSRTEIKTRILVLVHRRNPRQPHTKSCDDPCQ